VTSESTHLKMGFLLRCFQQLSTLHIATQRLPLDRQLVNNWCIPPGPLVLRRDSFNTLTIILDMDRTVSRRSEPNSRPAFMGEQPNPWDVRHRRITKTGFRPCSTCRSFSQAPLYLYTLRMISIHSEGTFVRLSYLL